MPRTRRRKKIRANKVNLFPLYTSSHMNRKHHANFLLIRSGEKSHYVVIKSLSRPLRGRSTDNHQTFVGEFCLYSFSSEILREKHAEMCSQHLAQKTVYPTPGENVMKFKNFGNLLEVPFTIYADFESLVIPNEDSKKRRNTFRRACHVQQCPHSRNSTETYFHIQDPT